MPPTKEQTVRVIRRGCSSSLKETVAMMDHIIKALTILAYTVGGGEEMLKQSIYIWHCFSPLQQIATLHQKAGQCNAWTKHRACWPSLFALKPCALVYQMERKVIAIIISIRPSQIPSSWIMPFSMAGGILKTSWEKGFCIFLMKAWKDPEQTMARNWLKLHHQWW